MARVTCGATRRSRHEFRLLRILAAEGLPVPTPRHLEPSGAILGTSCIICDHIRGRSGAEPSDRDAFVAHFAACLARIHGVGARPELGFLPRRWLPSPAPANPPVLLHGDFWPGNVLMHEGRLAAVIDWEDAAIGDPLADLANARLEILWALDGEAADRFTALYLAKTAVDPAGLAHWDHWIALQRGRRIAHWGLDPARLQSMQTKLAGFRVAARKRLGRG